VSLDWKLTDDQLSALEEISLTSHRLVTLPTMQLRALVRELRELRDMAEETRAQAE
jgi:hypothetical protein